MYLILLVESVIFLIKDYRQIVTLREKARERETLVFLGNMIIIKGL